MGGGADSDLWRLTLQHSPIGMALVGLDGRMLMVNRAMCEMLGYDAEELMSKPGFQAFTHPDDLQGDLEQFGRAVAGEIDSYRLAKRYVHAEGRIVLGDLSVALVRGEGGDPIHVIAQIVDVTEQRDQQERIEAARAEIEREHQTLEAIFDAVSVGLLLIGSDGRYERTNRRHREIMNLPFPDGHRGAAGQLGHVYFPDGTLMGKEDMPSYRAMQGEEFDDYTYWVGDDPRTRAAFSASARQVRGPIGERLGAALAYQEITDLMRAMKVQDEFVSSVSHELRTPLTSVLGHLEMLCEQDGLPPDVLDRLQVVQRNALRLRTLLSDLLHVGQVGEGRLHLQREPVDVAALVDEAIEASRPFAATCGVDVEVDAPARLFAVLDEHRIRQVIDNLLSNAIKYGGAGGSVRVVLRQHGESLELRVSDTGMGIAPEEVDHVFGRFFRGGEALERHIPGTGLGLNIVSSIVAAHGGVVTVQSEVGRGSTFRVTLPHAADEGLSPDLGGHGSLHRVGQVASVPPSPVGLPAGPA